MAEVCSPRGKFGVSKGEEEIGIIVLQVRSLASLVMQASFSLVEVDILELLSFPCPGVGIFNTSI